MLKSCSGGNFAAVLLQTYFVLIYFKFKYRQRCSSSGPGTLADLLVGGVGLDQCSCSTPDPVSAWMGDRLRAGKLSPYVTSQPSQLSLAIPPWVGAMNTSLGWDGNRRSGRRTGHASQTIVVHLPRGLTAYQGNEHPAYSSLEYVPPFHLFCAC